MNQQEKYKQWLQDQEPLQIGKTYQLLDRISLVSRKDQVEEMTLKSMIKDDCVFDCGGVVVEMKSYMAFFKIYNALS